MASKKWQAKRRILYKKRKTAKRAAENAVQNAGAQREQLSKVSEGASETGVTPQIKKGSPDQKASACTPPSKPIKPTANPAARDEIKTIDLRQRLRLLEKTVVWTAERGARELRQSRDKVRKLEQEIRLWKADQKKLNKLEQDSVTLRADIAALKRGW